MGGDYGGSSSLTVEYSTNSGSTWTPCDVLARAMVEFGTGGAGSLVGVTDTVNKTITSANIPGTIDTSTFRVRLVATNKTCSIWEHSSFGTYETLCCNQSDCTALIYAMYLQT
jgi:hypothetical protein